MTLPIGIHGEHHLEFALYVTLGIIILYMPPKGRLYWLSSFVEAHFGDSIGLYLLHLGIGLVILAGVWPEMTQVGQVGQSLILAAMGVLKLTKPAGQVDPPPGGSASSTTVIQSAAASPSSDGSTPAIPATPAVAAKPATPVNPAR